MYVCGYSGQGRLGIPIDETVLEPLFPAKTHKEEELRKKLILPSNITRSIGWILPKPPPKVKLTASLYNSKIQSNTMNDYTPSDTTPNPTTIPSSIIFPNSKPNSPEIFHNNNNNNNCISPGTNNNNNSPASAIPNQLLLTVNKPRMHSPLVPTKLEFEEKENDIPNPQILTDKDNVKSEVLIIDQGEEQEEGNNSNNENSNKQDRVLSPESNEDTFDPNKPISTLLDSSPIPHLLAPNTNNTNDIIIATPLSPKGIRVLSPSQEKPQNKVVNDLVNTSPSSGSLPAVDSFKSVNSFNRLCTPDTNHAMSYPAASMLSQHKSEDKPDDVYVETDPYDHHKLIKVYIYILLYIYLESICSISSCWFKIKSSNKSFSWYKSCNMSN